MNIENRWRFYAADFSVNASSNNPRRGNVTLVRCPDDVAAWHKIVNEIEDEDDFPELYAIGKGLTLEEALVNANLIASHLPELESEEIS